MLSINDVADARRSIAQSFLIQCRDGPQSVGLPHGTRACGQRLRESASPQRGLHGTAAAIRVLAAHDDPEARALVPELVQYVQQRESLEPPERRDRVREDLANVIKVSELLHALHYVEGAVTPTEDLRSRLARTLLDGMVGGAGWTHYTDRPRAVEPLPTAFAVRALAAGGYDVDGPVQSLLSSITGATSASTTQTADVSVRVLCLYVLTFGRDGKPLVPVEQLERPFTSLWGQLSPLLRHHDIEQNIEYQRNGSHHYVRVPWQLYLIALAAQLAPFRSFAARSVQARLRSILAAATGAAGFYYAHSGSQMSARTNAILYEVLSLVERRLPQVSWKLRPGAVLDRLVNSRATAWLARGLALLVILLSVLAWEPWKEGVTSGLAAMAPDFLSALLLLLLSARRPR